MKQRIFIAFPVSKEAKEELNKVQNKFIALNKKVHVLWSKTNGIGHAIEKTLTQEFKKIGLIEDKKDWKPHITLGRNKAHQAIQGFNNIKINKIVWLVNTIELIKSDLKPNGSKYTILESYNLKNK